MLQNPHVLLTFDKVHNPLRLPREATSMMMFLHHSKCQTVRTYRGGKIISKVEGAQNVSFGLPGGAAVSKTTF